MSLIPAFYCLLVWFTFTQRVSTKLTVPEGLYIQSLTTEGAELPVGCVYTDEKKTVQGVGPQEGQECVPITEDAYTAMESGTPYSCPLGLCRSYNCEASGLILKCWK
ncbi:hypothetical protein V5799_029537 [Amblyomma americanum]|uniref:Evasin n=1 Tax=Amblyomma americanum TaxID=6943 RepID=A0AAQ4ER78_AMBAM